MPLDPGEFPDQVDAAPAPAEPEKHRRIWPSRLLHICFAIFTFEIGLFLVIFPWMDDVWRSNYFQGAFPTLQNVWEDPYFRGALTGLGVLNIYLACWDLLRTLRRA